MAGVTGERVNVANRKYREHFYQINYYEQTGKVDLSVRESGRGVTLKMSRDECEELVIRLQYTLHLIDRYDI